MWNTDAKYTIVPTSKFKNHYATYIKNGFDIDELDEIINMLANGDHLGSEYHDHPLKGRLKGFRGCHVRPDWVLIYKRTDKDLVLALRDTGTHSVYV